jgi:hypothetical protein
MGLTGVCPSLMIGASVAALPCVNIASFLTGPRPLLLDHGSVLLLSPPSAPQPSSSSHPQEPSVSAPPLTDLATYKSLALRLAGSRFPLPALIEAPGAQVCLCAFAPHDLIRPSHA